MKSVSSVILAAFAGLAVLSIAADPAWSGQPAEGPVHIRQAQEFYSAGQQYMKDGNFTAANDAFMKAELVLSSVETLPEVPEAPDAQPRLQQPPPPPQAPQIKSSSVVPAVALDPDIYYNLGVGALQKGDFIQAEAAFLRVVELAPLDKEACYNLGVLYEKYIYRPKDAVSYYKRYIVLSDEGDRDAERVKGWVKEINERARE